MQPLDVGVLAPIKNAGRRLYVEWARAEGAKMTLTEFIPLFHQAYVESTSASTIKASFRRTGLYP